MSLELTEREIDGIPVFEGNLRKVYQDRVTLPSAGEAAREYVKHPGTVVIVAMLDNGKVLFVRKFRPACQRVFLELPAGCIDPGEHALAAAKRVLIEESGHVAALWTPLCTIHPCVAYSDEAARIFVARKLEYLGTELVQDEPLEPTSLPLAGAISSVMAGTISEAKTISTLFLIDQSLRSGAL